MSLAGGKNLSNLISALRGTYKSIDMRAVLAKNLSAKNDKTWYCVLLKIRLTKQELSEVQREHKKKLVRSKHKNYFRIIFDCKPIEQIDDILMEIQQGRFNINGVLSKLLGYEYEKILDKELTDDSGYSNDEESNGFKNKIVSIPMHNFPMTAIERLGIRSDDIEISTSDLEYCLCMTSVSNSNNIIILIPLYCKMLPVPIEDQGKYLSIFQIHEDLVRNLFAKIRISPDGHIGDTKEIILSKFKTISRDEHIEQMAMAVLPLTAKIREVAKPEDHVEIQISHKKFPSIKLIETLWVHEFLPRKKSYDTLTKIMNRIDPDLKKLEQWLEGESNNQRVRSAEFEMAITILLSLCGFRAIHVGDKYETITEPARHKAHKKSSIGTDIIALPVNIDKIFLCQCTTDSPKMKVTDVLDFVKEMRSILNHNQITIHPVIFTQIQANQISALIPEAGRKGVSVVTITELRTLLGEIRDGHTPYDLATTLMLPSPRYSNYFQP